MTYYDIIMGILCYIVEYYEIYVEAVCWCVCVCCLLSIIPDCSSGSVAGICCNCTRCMMQPWVFPSRSSEPDVQEAGSVSWIVNPWFQWPTPVRSWALLIPSLGCVLESWRGCHSVTGVCILRIWFVGKQCGKNIHEYTLKSQVILCLILAKTGKILQTEVMLRALGDHAIPKLPRFKAPWTSWGHSLTPYLTL